MQYNQWNYSSYMRSWNELQQEDSHRGIDVNKIITIVRGKVMYRQPKSWSCVIGIINVFTVLGILWFIWFKFTNRCCPCIWKCILNPEPPHIVINAQELNGCDTDLLVVKHENEGKPAEALREASPENTPGDNTKPAAFVPRRRLAAYHLWRKDYHALHLFGWVDDDDVCTAPWKGKETFDHQPQ